MNTRVWLLLWATGCAGVLAHPEAASLVGASAPLLPNPSIRLAIAGAVEGRAAEIELDTTASMTFVSTGCIDDPPLESGQLRFSDPLSAKEQVYPVARVTGLRVGSLLMRPLSVALMGNKRCVVVLGLDLLADVALQVSVATRRVAFLPSRPRGEWLAQRRPGSQQQVIELTRDPTHDWPLLPVRVHQEPETLTATFVLSTRDRFSRIFDEAARAQGLLPGLELLRGHGVKTVPTELEAFSGLPYERLELAPGFGVSAGTLDVMKGPAPHGVAGSLAVDVWGRFDFTYDIRAGILALRQPALVSTGTHHVCDRGHGASETECFELHAEKTGDGLNTVATAWRPLEQGGRLYFDVTGPAPLPCRIGVSFSEGDRGRSAQHVFPWRRLAQTMPVCAAALAQATEAKLGLFEEGGLLECPGVCGFVQDLRTSRVSCECQPASGGTGSESERRFFELYRRLLGPTLPSPEVEPADPD